jgi:hypothetical protein
LYDTLLQYVEATQIPGKWSGTLFNVVLYWYKQIKECMRLQLIGLLPTQTLHSMQSAVEDVDVLEYMWQIDHKEYVYWKDTLTYMRVMEARNPTCCIHKSMTPGYKYKVVTENSNVSVHLEDINQFVDKHDGNTVPEEEQDIFTREHKELCIAEWIYLSRNPKPLQAPQDVYHVGDHMLHDFFDPGTPKHKVDYSGGNHGNMYKANGRNNAVNGVDG